MITDITERRRAEQALRQSEARFATAFRANPAAMSITRLHDGRFIDINASHERLFGYQRDELIGQSADSIHIYANANQRSSIVQIMREQGTLRETELTLRTKSGEIREVLCSLEILELDGEACLLGSVFDITVLKRAEQALQRYTERLQVLVEASGVFAKSAGDYQRLLTQVAQHISETLQSSCTIRILSDDAQWLDVVALGHFDPALLQAMQELIRQERMPIDDPQPAAVAMRSGQPLLIPLVDSAALPAMIPASQQPLLAVMAPHTILTLPLHTHGQTIGCLTLARSAPEAAPFDEDDLTLAQDLADRAALAISNARLFSQVQRELAERIKAEQGLRESEENLRIVTETAGIGLALVDANHHYRYTNQTHKHFLRLPAEDLTGQHVADVLGPLYEQTVRQRLERAFAGESVSEYLDLPMLPDMQRHCEVRLKLGAYTTDPVVVVVLTDITERKRAEEQLRYQAELLDQVYPVQQRRRPVALLPSLAR